MTETGNSMVEFLGVPADARLLGEDLANLPDAEQRRAPGRVPAVATREHDRLVALGSLLTAATLIGGIALALYGGVQLLFNGGGVVDAAIAAAGALLAGTHWGWVHVAEYVGVTIDDRRQRAIDEGGRDWLRRLEPYPRFSVSTSVLDDASTRVRREIHQPVLTDRHTYTFTRRTTAEEIYDADTSAAVIADAVETMRRRARLETDRLRELWEAASGAYAATLLSADDERQRLAAQRAAAAALSEHLNASLREPPLVE